MPKLSIVKVKLDREVNSYIVSCATTKEAVVIDPGLPAEKIVEQAAGLTILAGGIGRQMPETDLRRQMMSIGTKLLRLPPSTALYPGHGPATSLERELTQNPIFRGAGARV